MVTLANQFSRTGFSVDLVLVDAKGAFLSEVDSGVNIVPLNSKKTVLSIFPLVKYLRRERPDVMLSTLLMANIIAVLASKLAFVKTKIVVREAINPSAHNKFILSSQERIIATFRKWTLKNADHIVTPSEGVKEDLIKCFNINGLHISTIFNPIDMHRISSESLKPLPNSMIFLHSLPVILGIGRLNEQKDFESLIKAFSIVCKTKDSYLVILGEGDERENLQDLISQLDLRGRVFLPGFVNNPFSFVHMAAVYVLSSKYEGLPNTLVQAAVLGKSIVSTNCPSGPFEILEEGKYGRLVSIGDYKMMAEGILEGLEGKLRLFPKEKAFIKYDSVNIAKEYLRILLN